MEYNREKIRKRKEKVEVERGRLKMNVRAYVCACMCLCVLVCLMRTFCVWKNRKKALQTCPKKKKKLTLRPPPTLTRHRQMNEWAVGLTLLLLSHSRIWGPCNGLNYLPNPRAPHIHRSPTNNQGLKSVRVPHAIFSDFG